MWTYDPILFCFFHALYMHWAATSMCQALFWMMEHERWRKDSFLSPGAQSGGKANKDTSKCHVTFYTAAAATKSLQSCPTLCDPIDGSPPGSPIPGILQARTLEWVAISFSNAWKWKVKLLSCVRLFATPWTAAHQAPPSMGFSRQEDWSGAPLPSPICVSTYAYF